MLNEVGKDLWSATCPNCHEAVATRMKGEEAARRKAHTHILDAHWPDRRLAWRFP